MEQIPDLYSEIESIPNKEVRLLTQEVFKSVPKYFFTLPASSSGKYHPPKERAAYGLIYHTKEVCRMGTIIYGSYIGVDLSQVLSAILLHDVARYGLGRAHSSYSLTNHPDLAADLVLNKANGLDIQDSYVVSISNAVRSHMGRWGRVPCKCDLDWIVHLADCVASKNW